MALSGTFTDTENAWNQASAVGYAGGSTTTSTTYANLADAIATSVTVNITSNGIALVLLGSNVFGSTNSQQCFTSFVISGANTLAASDVRAVVYGVGTSGSGSGSGLGAGMPILVTGLLPGSTTFTIKYRVNTGTMTVTTSNIGVIAF